jgi:hypothetical protein
VKALTTNPKIKEMAMKNLISSKVLARNVLSVLLVVSTTLTVEKLATATDANDQPPKGALRQDSASLSHADYHESSLWERNLRMDGFDGAQLVRAQFIPAPYCYTFAGPVCSMIVAIPQGSPCMCPTPLGYLTGTSGL